jgi:hypothetical protein
MSLFSRASSFYQKIRGAPDASMLAAVEIDPGCALIPPVLPGSECLSGVENPLVVNEHSLEKPSALFTTSIDSDYI